jgi:hypothetical protein
MAVRWVPFPELHVHVTPSAKTETLIDERAFLHHPWTLAMTQPDRQPRSGLATIRRDFSSNKTVDPSPAPSLSATRRSTLSDSLRKAIQDGVASREAEKAAHTSSFNSQKHALSVDAPQSKSAGFPVPGLTQSNHPRRHTMDLLSRRCFPPPVLLDLIPPPAVIKKNANLRWSLLGLPSPYPNLTFSSVTNKNKSWRWLRRRKTSFTREVQVCRLSSLCPPGKQVAAIDFGVTPCRL